MISRGSLPRVFACVLLGRIVLRRGCCSHPTPLAWLHRRFRANGWVVDLRRRRPRPIWSRRSRGAPASPTRNRAGSICPTPTPTRTPTVALPPASPRWNQYLPLVVHVPATASLTTGPVCVSVGRFSCSCLSSERCPAPAHHRSWRPSPAICRGSPTRPAARRSASATTAPHWLHIHPSLPFLCRL